MDLAKFILPAVFGFVGLTGAVAIETYSPYSKQIIYEAQKEIEVKRAIRTGRYNDYPSDPYVKLKAELEFDANNKGRVEKVVKEFELAHPNSKIGAQIGAGIFGFLLHNKHFLKYPVSLHAITFVRYAKIPER